MAAYALTRFTSPNGGVSVNQTTGDQYIPAAYGQALKNVDQFAAYFLTPDVIASRPAAGTARRFYLATDTKVLSYDDGAAWHSLGVLDEAGNWTALQRFSGGISADGTHTLTLPSVTDTLAVVGHDNAFSAGQTFFAALAVSLANPGYNSFSLTASTGTNGGAMTIVNTAGTAYFGLDNSTGGLFGNGNYALNIQAPAGSDLSFNLGSVSIAQKAKITAAGAFFLGGVSVPAPAPITNSLGSDVSINNASNYFDGPSVAQGTTGMWFASGSVTVLDTAASTVTFLAVLWDGTTVIDSKAFELSGSSASLPTVIALSGKLASPAGNIRISVKSGTTTGKILFNQSGNSKDSTITAFRVA